MGTSQFIPMWTGKLGGELRQKRWTWQQAEHGQVMNGAKVRGMRGKYLLNEHWKIFVDDRVVPRDVINSHAHVQPKAVFSCAMTVMEKICGWGEEQKWVGSLFAACMWIYTRAVPCDEHDSTQESLRRKMLSIMESVNWVCEEALEEHEWVSPVTISLK